MLDFLLFFYKNIFKKAIDNIQIHDIIKWYNTDLWAFKENFESEKTSKRQDEMQEWVPV